MNEVLATETRDVEPGAPFADASLRARTWQRANAHPLVRSSFALIANTVLGSAIGMVCWTVAARLFPPDRLGPVSAATTLLGLGTMAASLGLTNTIVRYLPATADQYGLVRRALLVTGASGVVTTAVVWFVAMRAGAFGGRLGVTALPAATLLVVFAVTGNVLDAVALARRRPALLLVETVAGGTARLAAIVLVATVGGGEPGLLAASAVAAMFGTLALARVARSRFALDSVRSAPARLWPLRRYAGAQLVSNLVSIVPGAIVGSLAVAANGSAAGAYVAMPFMVLGLVNVVPNMVCRSLFAEASRHRERLRPLAVHALVGSLAATAAGAAVIALLAPRLLAVFGPAYAAHATGLMRWLCLGAVIAVPNYVADTVFSVRADRRGLVTATVIGTVAIVVAITVASRSGVAAIGIGWIVGQVVYAAVNWTLIARHWAPAEGGAR